MKKILLFISTLIVILNVRVVRALDYHEVGSDYYTNATELATINTCSSSMSLFGYNSELNLYKNGNKPLYILDFPTDTVRCNSALSFNINRTLNSGETYEGTLDFVRNTSTFDINFYLRNPIIRNANLLSFDTTCTGNSCTISFKFEMTANDTQFYIDFPQYDEGLSLVLFDTGITNLYMPQVRSLTTFDTSGIEDNQNTIIDQNQTIIDKQEQTNDKLDNIEDSIIDSNKETQDVIKDQFNDCRDSKNLFDTSVVTFGNANNASYSIDGTNKITITNKGAWSRVPITITGLKSNTTYTISSEITNTSSAPSGLYIDDDNYSFRYTSTKVSVTTTSNGSITFVLYSNWSGESRTDVIIYDKIQVEEGISATAFEEPGEICSNKIDETNDKLDGIQGAITDSSSPNTSALEGSAGWLPDGPVDSILNLPLNMLQALNIALSKSCTPLQLTFPFVNQPFEMPCISTLYQKIDGFDTLWKWIGSIVSVLMLYTYLLKLYKWVDDTLTFRENNHIDNWGGV